MPQKVRWLDSAKSDLQAIDQQTALRILRSLWRFLDKNEGDVKQLQGVYPAEHRLRVGNYRLRFRFDQSGIVVLSVRHRRQAYRDL